MDNYIVSARKYRPANFHTVIGQKSLTTTLKNAIVNGKLAHAYLFCGPRGVGKTTCARIFAKSINCLNPRPDGEACNECESCTSFNENRSYNIHELDAASNNGVDDIRSLTEQVRIPPQIGKYKVYIIDEVHMLSTGAFNAFLKTLEEPPHHAIFILATTEKHKLLPTILSRCQIYDFSRIHINDIVEYLEYVSQQENIKAEREALTVIAQKADGGMRDALSIFDQVAGFSQGNVTYKLVIENLNVLDYEYYFVLAAAVLQGNMSESLLLLNEILGKGFDGQHIITGMASFFRDVLVCKDPQTVVLFEVGDSIQEKYVRLAQQCPAAFLYRAIDLSNECDLNYRFSRNRRLLIELLLIRLCQLNQPSNLEEDKKKTIIEPLVVPGVSPQAQTPASAEAVPGSTPVTLPARPEEGVSKAPGAARPVCISIKKEAEPEAEKSAQEKQAPEAKDAFTQESLDGAWKMYAGRQEDIYLKNMLLNLSPVLKENFRIEVAILNQTQEIKLNEKLSDLTAYLSVQLNNTFIRIETKMDTGEMKQTLFTDRDKYRYMSSVNPKLNLLAKEFNLRLD
ncbi:MAG: DNA polymerase III subunit gamma/tau [Candidatus Symbiothrix sp.]|jgi:DNA polymerase-3 subunit gamma/tau|nr:DNA polymerase III subunit gamma/tau [Candidatus Symbiothrix sp.]